MSLSDHYEFLGGEIGRANIAVGQPMCVIDGIEFLKYPHIAGLLSRDGRRLVHNGIEVDSIIKTGTNIRGDSYAILEKVDGKPLLLRMQIEGKSTVKIISTSLEITGPKSSRWLGLYNGENVFYREDVGLVDKEGNPILLNGHKIRELVYREGDTVLMELENGDEASMIIQTELELNSGRTKIGLPRIHPEKITFLGDLKNPIGSISGKTIHFIDGIGLITGTYQEIYIDGKRVTEVASYDTKKCALVVELSNGKEVCIVLEPNNSTRTQRETRRNTDLLMGLAA